ncbi:MAG: 2-C-methyl-D-erythritol 4-phosphate cytidylyltransferase [Lachnospiraceae bacterium]|nr:2-C-methyl-D-erythritol 4-phosphate cytidylyltransferase [Lachnospiraceae bacterium]
MVSAIILAAGKGSRMNSDIPKQFMKVNDKPVIYYCLKSFSKANVDEIVIVTSEEYISYCNELVAEYKIKNVKAVINGGKERYDSVFNGLRSVNGAEDDVILIHDAARANVSFALINSITKEVYKSGAAIPVVPVKDTIKIVEDGKVVNTPLRSSLNIVQTPQGFNYGAIFKAYMKMQTENHDGITDDSMVMEIYGDLPVKTVLGDYSNFKITTPEDIKQFMSLKLDD